MVFRAEPRKIQTWFQQTTSNSSHNQAEKSPPSFKAVGLKSPHSTNRVNWRSVTPETKWVGHDAIHWKRKQLPKQRLFRWSVNRTFFPPPYVQKKVLHKEVTSLNERRCSCFCGVSDTAESLTQRDWQLDTCENTNWCQMELFEGSN